MIIKHLESPKLIAGIEVRTKNSEEMSSNGKISKLWERFFIEDIKSFIKDKVSENIYCVYSNYESDHTGEYNYLIGYEIKNVQKFDNSKIIIQKIETSKYSLIETEKGQIQKVLVDAWEKIWKMDTVELGGKRLFKTDYELYPNIQSQPDELFANIFICIE